MIKMIRKDISGNRCLQDMNESDGYSDCGYDHSDKDHNNGVQRGVI